MKRINTLFLIAFLLVGTLGFVVATEDDSVETDIPEARKIGFFENAFDRMKFAFVFNKEKKIERALELAEKRLAEAELFAEDDPERFEEAQERYENFVMKAEEILEKISEAKVKNENRSIGDMEKIVRIQNNFERHRDHADEIYTRAFARFEENNASDEKIARFENFYERALNHSDRMEEKILQKRENAIKRHKILAEKSDKELENILETVEEREGLTQARERRAERAMERVQRIVEIRHENINRVMAHFNETNLTDEQKEQIANRIEIANQKIQEFEIRAHERIEAYQGLGLRIDLNNAIEKEL